MANGEGMVGALGCTKSWHPLSSAATAAAKPQKRHGYDQAATGALAVQCGQQQLCCGFGLTVAAVAIASMGHISCCLALPFVMCHTSRWQANP